MKRHAIASLDNHFRTHDNHSRSHTNNCAIIKFITRKCIFNNILCWISEKYVNYTWSNHTWTPIYCGGFTVHFIPVQYVFHPASAEIELWRIAQGMPPRNRIPLEQRQRIVRAFEDDGEDYLFDADTLGVNRSTARSIVDTFEREGSRKDRVVAETTSESTKKCGIASAKSSTRTVCSLCGR